VAFYALAIISYERPLILIPIIFMSILTLLISTLPKTWVNSLNCRDLIYNSSFKDTFLSDLTEVYTKHLRRSSFLKLILFYLLKWLNKIIVLKHFSVLCLCAFLGDGSLMLFIFSYVTSIIMYEVIRRVIPTNRYLAKVAFKADFCCAFGAALKKCGVAVGNGFVKAQKYLIGIGGGMYGAHQAAKGYGGYLNHDYLMEKSRQEFKLKEMALNGVINAAPEDRQAVVSAVESLESRGLFKIAPMEEPLIVDANTNRSQKLSKFISGSLKKS